MIKIIPAVLPKTLAELEAGLQALDGISPEVQIDLVGANIFKDREMPHWQSFDFELDLMLPSPADDLDALLGLGPSRIVIHAQGAQAKEALERLQSLRDGNYPVASGVALLPSATPEALEEFAGLYDFVQVMGIDRVGAQGRPFNPAAAELVRRIRAIYPALPLQVDGGVNKDSVPLLARAGADRLVAGSAIVGAADPRAAYKELYNLANVS